ncbi:MAG: cyclic nucleotide-binding domain-containing protein [Magnetococcus sp. DMHC-6]
MTILKAMEQIPFFWHFTPEEKADLVKTEALFEHYLDGEYIIHEGGGDSSLFIMISGKALVTRNVRPSLILATLESGAVFGELSFLTNRTRSTNVIAQGEVTVFKLDSHDILKKMNLSLQNKIKDQLIDILVHRLDDMNQTLLGVLR